MSVNTYCPRERYNRINVQLYIVVHNVFISEVKGQKYGPNILHPTIYPSVYIVPTPLPAI